MAFDYVSTFAAISSVVLDWDCIWTQCLRRVKGLSLLIGHFKYLFTYLLYLIELQWRTWRWLRWRSASWRWSASSEQRRALERTKTRSERVEQLLTSRPSKCSCAQTCSTHQEDLNHNMRRQNDFMRFTHSKQLDASLWNYLRFRRDCHSKEKK